MQAHSLGGGQDAVSSLQLTAIADPALDSLTVSDYGSAPGQRVTVTITARNVGLSQAEGMSVPVYEDQVGSGTLHQTIPLTVSLEFGDLLKGASKSEVLRAINDVAGGAAIFSPAIARRMMTYFSHFNTAPLNTPFLN